MRKTKTKWSKIVKKVLWNWKYYLILWAVTCTSTIVIANSAVAGQMDIRVSLPPIIRTEKPAKILTTKEHICAATNGENCDVIYNLCKHESYVWITHNPPCQQYSVNKNKNGTFDYSWLQVNDTHIIGRPASKGKGTITIECVYDLYCVSRWANEQIKKGNGHIWAAWDKI